LKESTFLKKHGKGVGRVYALEVTDWAGNSRGSELFVRRKDAKALGKKWATESPGDRYYVSLELIWNSLPEYEKYSKKISEVAGEEGIINDLFWEEIES